MAAGINVAFGHDCVMDPWYRSARATCWTSPTWLHVAQMTGLEAMRHCFDAVTAMPPSIMGLEGYGLEPGCHADLSCCRPRPDRGDPPASARGCRSCAAAR